MNRNLLMPGLACALAFMTTGCAVVGAGAGRQSECSRVASLSREGEHKPAVDAYEEILRSGKSCSEGVALQVSHSRSKVDRADNFVRKGFKRKKEGNLLSARANMEKALQIYPNYYWVQNLIRNLDRSIEAEINALKGEAQYLESLGDLDGASKRIREARALAPENETLGKEEARLEEAKAREERELDVMKVLQQAEAHMQASRFTEAEKTLSGRNNASLLGSRGERMLAEVVRRRSELIVQRLAVSREAEQKGDLEVAAGHLRYVLELSRPEDGTTPETVEFGRLLGVKLFSVGRLVKAREIWSAAFDLDPGNEKLAGYLKEVDARLESLEKIKGGAK